MGLGAYVLVQSKNWDQIVQAPDAGAILVVLVGLTTFVVAFFGCCGASNESQCMLSTYAMIVGLVFIVEVAAAILLLLYTREVSITFSFFLSVFAPVFRNVTT
jgi:CD63 antigen